MVERRNDDMTRDRIEQLSITVERLVVISDNQSKSIEGLQHWVSKHDEQYHALDKRMDETSLVVANWSQQISDVRDQIKLLIASMNRISEVGLKVKGGWITLTMIVSIIIGTISILKSFGFL